MNKTIVVRAITGSRLFGTNTVKSDKDYKGIFIPPAREILLQQANYTSDSSTTKSNHNERNSSDDVDVELFTLTGFIRLALEAQPVALEMLFIPQDLILHTTPIWEEIVENRQKLLSSNIKSYFGYAQKQVAKYGIKGSRVAAVRHVLNILKSYPEEIRLNKLDTLKTAIGTHEHVQWINIKDHNRNEDIEHLEVCNRKVPIFDTVKRAKEVYQRIFDEYGKRSIEAEKNQSVDWKALSHAVRVAQEAEELLLTGNISLPCPNRELLLQIKEGKLPYNTVADMIEKGLENVEKAHEKSILPNKADSKFWEEFICKKYRQVVLSEN